MRWVAPLEPGGVVAMAFWPRSVHAGGPWTAYDAVPRMPSCSLACLCLRAVGCCCAGAGNAAAMTSGAHSVHEVGLVMLLNVVGPGQLSDAKVSTVAVSVKNFLKPGRE